MNPTMSMLMFNTNAVGSRVEAFKTPQVDTMWVVPPGVTSMTMYLWGGGAGVGCIGKG